MTKQEFQERVGKIAENLTEAMYQYNDGNIDIHTFKQIMRDEMSEYPYELGLANDSACEFNEDLEYGELYEADELGADVEAQKDFVESYISGAHEWGTTELNADGSGSFLIALLGYEGEDY
jgi:hypothetical protein